MKKIAIACILCGLIIVPISRANTPVDLYDYPFVNSYEATMIGTPEIYRADIPDTARTEERTLTVFKNRQVPDVLWYHNKMKYSIAFHKKKAPLIINIAGTGAGYDSLKMIAMQKAFFNAGFHVLSLSSPTHPNFIVTASESMVPGHIEQDARDLYRVMALAWDQIKDKINVSEFYLTGYSLGAAQSAFVSKLDEEKKIFNFKKVLMINPPVNLFNSVGILDEMLKENIPGGMAHFDDFLNKVFEKFSNYYKEENRVDFSDPDFLYEMYKKNLPKETILAAIIGIAFRLSSGNMIFTSDVMAKNGYIVPASLELSVCSSLTDYGIVTFQTSFTDYFHEFFFPYFKAFDTSLTKQDIIHKTSLKSIEDYLTKATKIGLVTNEDDLILAPGEIEFFRQVFGPRAIIYPNGGHCGNMEHKSNVAYMINFFKN
ncbi:MAG: alpha/beta hydrolase [Desulfobacula sp.]|uniref:hypothetical protein n=1 Tax=Desulfobacula sp. TaxID=2593537 RepID=UPI0025BF914C|nr:hypothetical protein [Desulfobacula sp.]MCD4719598.1 alpha/beta hydrolase [Desulfobacula sp.]